MLLTRTIRRKMVFGLVLVMGMLTILAVSSISGLISYGGVVEGLEFSLNQTPRKRELVESIGNLNDALLLYVSDDSRQLAAADGQFAERLKDARRELDDFWNKLEALPPTEATRLRRPISRQLLPDLWDGMDLLEEQQSELGDEKKRHATAVAMMQTVRFLKQRAQKMPDYREGLSQILHEANQAYRTRIWLASISSVVVFGLFLSLLRCGYRWIFDPIRVLYQGASRVAQGDFDYRVKLATNDEMADLAESFNKMTARFQEIACDLDGQVRERSKQLVRSERLAGVGFLAAGVAHEINSPLTAIKWTSESLQDRMRGLVDKLEKDDQKVFEKYLKMINDEAIRCQEITARLLDFSRGQETVRSPNDLTVIISEVLMLVSHMSRFRDRNIEFEHAAACFAEVNGPEIKQVVLNLVANGLESLEAGGTLRITLTDHTDHMNIEFADDGCGMEPEVIENLFEPFFTKRKSGKGTGLGLSISHRIISDHGGTIEVTSDGPGRGSTFQIRLPRRAQSRDAA